MGEPNHQEWIISSKTVQKILSIGKRIFPGRIIIAPQNIPNPNIFPFTCCEYISYRFEMLEWRWFTEEQMNRLSHIERSTKFSDYNLTKSQLMHDRIQHTTTKHKH